MNFKEMYNSNDDFRTYVDKYCETRKVDLNTALSHKTVQEVGKYYNDLSAFKIGG